MSDINEVRKRLEVIASEAVTYGDGDDLSTLDGNDLRALLALIDGQACSVHASGVYEVSGCPECGELHCCGGNDEDPRSHCMDCSVHPGKPTKGEGE